MKKSVFIAILFFIFGGVSGYFVYSGFAGKKNEERINISKYANENKEETRVLEDDIKEDARLNQQKSIARIDYPLIDIYFADDKEYKVELVKYMQKNVCREYIDSGLFFQENKEKFSILTVPSGMGTTPEFSLNIYEDGKCIKSIDCVKVRNGVLDNKW